MGAAAVQHPIRTHRLHRGPPSRAAAASLKACRIDGHRAAGHVIRACLVLGAVVVLGIGFGKGQRLPRDRGAWAHIAAAALLGNALPWLLFAYGERTGSSSIAGIHSGTAPVWTMTATVVFGVEKRLGLGRVHAFVPAEATPVPVASAE